MLGSFIRRILLFRVLFIGVPYFQKPPHMAVKVYGKARTLGPLASSKA